MRLDNSNKISISYNYSYPLATIYKINWNVEQCQIYLSSKYFRTDVAYRMTIAFSIYTSIETMQCT